MSRASWHESHHGGNSNTDLYKLVSSRIMTSTRMELLMINTKQLRWLVSENRPEQRHRPPSPIPSSAVFLCGRRISSTDVYKLVSYRIMTSTCMGLLMINIKHFRWFVSNNKPERRHKLPSLYHRLPYFCVVILRSQRFFPGNFWEKITLKIMYG